jgi:hypothetical protein
MKFFFKIWYKSGFPAVVAEWRDHFDSVLPTRKAVCTLRQRFE